MNWTNEQEQVIRSRGRNLLVSAAAGSGKTAVLVERIIQMITEGAHPIDIDQLLVMTFTNAAAAEMRERIALAIEEKLKEQPGQEHLQRQATLVHYAQITTIDSFCLNLIRDHFHLLDIDPSFRIGDEGELLLLRQDVMEALLETYYEQGNPSFEQFVDTYASGKADGGIEDYILQIYTFAQSNPWPALWLEACRMELVQMESGHMMDTQWMKFLLTDVKQQMQELREQMQRAISVCMEEGGPSAYVKTLEEDADLLDGLEQAKDYETLNRR
ncbi:MAG: UvrD-helicase domain-containing protein, partial [Hungatella sp.]